MKKVLSILVPVAIIGIVIFMRFHQKNQVADAAKFEALAMVEMLPGFEENRQVYHDLVAAAHEEAFDQAFHMGGRRSRSRFDEGQYFARLGELMTQNARIGGFGDIAEAIDRDWMIHPRPVASAR